MHGLASTVMVAWTGSLVLRLPGMLTSTRRMPGATGSARLIVWATPSIFNTKAGRVSALWVGVEKTEPLVFLQSKVETALQRIGLEPERRRFAPHVTLARTERAAPEKTVAFVQAHNLFRAAPVPVEGFALCSSRLGKEQAVYEREVEYGLLEPRPAAAAAARA